MPIERKTAILAVLVAVLAAAPAEAADVIVVEGDRAIRRADPFAPAPERGRLPTRIPGGARIPADARAGDARGRGATGRRRRPRGGAGSAAALRAGRIERSEEVRWLRGQRRARRTLRGLRGARRTSSPTCSPRSSAWRSSAA